MTNQYLIGDVVRIKGETDKFQIKDININTHGGVIYVLEDSDNDYENVGPEEIREVVTSAKARHSRQNRHKMTDFMNELTQYKRNLRGCY